MKSFLFIWLFLLSTVVGGLEIKEDFLHHLSPKQRTLLNDFLLAIVQSSSGYVLFGDKPMDIQTCDLSSLRILSGMNPQTILLIKGKELWEDLNLSLHNKEYILTVFENDSNCNLVCINRKAFLRVVQDNLSLFRYVLGPNLTPEGLLQELLATKNDFGKVLKEDQVLLGILLGHGTENALLQSRYEELALLSHLDQNEEFPFISKTISKTWPVLPQKYSKQPSLGFHSLVEEEAALEKMIALSNKIKPFNTLEIPQFDCKVNSQETKELIAVYEENRKKIQKATASKNFLPDVLRKFFTTASQTLEIPSIPKEKNLCLPASREETIAKLVEIIQRTIGNDSKKFQNAFIQGVAAREKEQQMPIPNQFRRFKGIDQIQKDLECCKNLEKANVYFKRLGEREDLVCLVPNGIFYKTLKEGNEKITTSKLKKVSFQYLMQILGDPQTKDWGIVKQENIGSLIPGIAFSLNGMAEGEERVIYIHPEYAYGETSLFPPNIAFVAQVRLLHFEEGEQEVAIYPPHQLEQRDYKDLLTKFEVLRAEKFFDEGVEFWDSIKKTGSDFIDFQTFMKIYNANPEITQSFQTENQEQQFISDLEYYLLAMQKSA